MPRLFSYTMTFDTGAAPNPFFGICTLAICKPGIRRVAKPDDWVVGLGSKNLPCGDLSGRVVYAMRVEDIVSMEEYDRYALERWPNKIPDCKNSDYRRRVGDCIYDYTSGEATLRESVHGEDSQKGDLSGKNVLISSDYYYFGRSAKELPKDLSPIRIVRGHKSTANDPYLDAFVTWIRTLDKTLGEPCSEAKCHQKCSSQPRSCQTKC